jgi:hypothetical protein
MEMKSKPNSYPSLHHLPLIKKPTRPLRLTRFPITVLLLQITNDRQHRAILNRPTPSPERLRDSGADTAAKSTCVRGAAGRGAETACGACFGGFETLFYGCELGFETEWC